MKVWACIASRKSLRGFCKPTVRQYSLRYVLSVLQCAFCAAETLCIGWSSNNSEVLQVRCSIKDNTCGQALAFLQLSQCIWKFL